MEYNEKFDPQDITTRITNFIADDYDPDYVQGNLEGWAQSVAEEVLKMIVADLRPDLIARKWIVSDGNATETYKNWDLLRRAAEDWYYWLPERVKELTDENMPIADFSEIPEGDIDSLNSSIKLWEERIAEAAGYTTFAGHGNYSVSAASNMGLNLTVREVEQ